MDPRLLIPRAIPTELVAREPEPMALPADASVVGIPPNLQRTNSPGRMLGSMATARPPATSVGPMTPTMQRPPLSTAQALAPQATPQHAAGVPNPRGNFQTTATEWTPERRAMADELNRIGREYKSTVDQRRTQRIALSGYEKLKSRLETAAGTLSDLTALKKYPGMSEGEHGIHLQRQIIQHHENAMRIQKELRDKAQELNAQYKIPLGNNGFLKDYGAHMDEQDKQFDDLAVDTIGEAYARQPVE